MGLKKFSSRIPRPKKGFVYVRRGANALKAESSFSITWYHKSLNFIETAQIITMSMRGNSSLSCGVLNRDSLFQAFMRSFFVAHVLVPASSDRFSL